MSIDLQRPAPAASETTPLLASAAQTASITADFSEDPSLVMTSCAKCGAQMLDRKCKLVCSCGYFLSCSDYY